MHFRVKYGFCAPTAKADFTNSVPRTPTTNPQAHSNRALKKALLADYRGPESAALYHDRAERRRQIHGLDEDRQVEGGLVVVRTMDQQTLDRPLPQDNRGARLYEKIKGIGPQASGTDQHNLRHHSRQDQPDTGHHNISAGTWADASHAPIPLIQNVAGHGLGYEGGLVEVTTQRLEDVVSEEAHRVTERTRQHRVKTAQRMAQRFQASS